MNVVAYRVNARVYEEIFKYVSSRPYSEVANLIPQMQTALAIQEEEPKQEAQAKPKIVADNSKNPKAKGKPGRKKKLEVKNKEVKNQASNG